MILSADIGGTKTVVGLFEEDAAQLRLVREAQFPSREYETLEEILQEFLEQQPRPSLAAGCFGVAGAVIDGKSRITNLAWQLDEQVLADALGLRRIKLVNDLEAAAYGMLFLSPDELRVLNPGTHPRGRGNVAVVAAGTGLGEGMLYWDGSRHHPIASEGGHADFAPRSDEEIALLRYLQNKYREHVSYERVLSGPGFYNVYSFLRDSGYADEPAWLTEKLKSGDRNAAITEAGLAGNDPLCVKTLDLFCSIYGAEAGNLALKCLAVGGVYVGGGIAPKILPAIEGGSFIRGFFDKGRFSDLMKSMPVSVALNPQAPLIGAAHLALLLS